MSSIGQARRRAPATYYPDVECHLAPLRSTASAPVAECACDVCRAMRRNEKRKAEKAVWVPRVLSVEPYHGWLERVEESVA